MKIFKCNSVNKETKFTPHKNTPKQLYFPKHPSSF
uniref:Uncharacterized protein n=1 Tax=Rhizophora mucronata TaxID=61149 RepID=A0A2P2PBP9_RHIMU